MIGVIIQARTKSTRFPSKIYEPITEDRNTLQMVLEGVSKSLLPNKIILAMPEYDRAEFFDRKSLGEFNSCTDLRFETHFGDANDLVSRYFYAANRFEIDLVVRITADCPLIQGDIIDDMLTDYLSRGFNGYMCNNESICSKPYPSGLDVEIFPYWLLADTMRFSVSPSEREHVTPYMYDSGKYKLRPYLNLPPHRKISMKHPNFSFDTEADLELIRKIASHYNPYNELQHLSYALDSV